ncbi:methylated-DNA--[protein]-cysteine S-methyltrans ferase [Desulfonema ishimotonii]|uniref:Methylated-DNA--[protein]-cysteine S-methyltrans ferase n=1 Tax=Desulfonema ishimotonii TaxID=45657 RepID=A0A401FX37_9BACT|nr:MGMT family protein [Desulfonema ishimotonii]GBC61557.1 methylated-DNA--[protein]-cysteine S-methyltrans ferase [Desulfonema ishimotonii]
MREPSPGGTILSDFYSRNAARLAAQYEQLEPKKVTTTGTGSSPSGSHRVIGSNGSLTGFGGGPEVRQALLDLERRHC